MQNAESSSSFSIHHPAFTPELLEPVILQTRAAGVGLVIFSADGTILFHDEGADPFYSQYAVPALRQVVHDKLAACAGQMNAASPLTIWDCLPGALLCASPCVERRHLLGIVALMGKREDFVADEAVKRTCAGLGLDAQLIEKQAAALPSHGPQRLGVGLGLAMTILADRLRSRALEGELNSLSTQLANTYEELSLIDQVSSGMRVNRKRDDFFRQACLDVMEVINVRAMGVAQRTDKCDQEPVLYGQLTLPPDDLRRLTGQLLGELSQDKSCLLINNLAENPAYRWFSPHAKQVLAVPLQRGEQVLGCLVALDKKRGEFDSVDSKLLLSIASTSAIYLENAVLFGDLHDLTMGLLHSLTSAVDAKDAYTCGHSERVALLSRHLAVKIGLPDAQIEHVYMAGLLHDVGKIGVPESVLQKTGRLTPDEFEVMKKHSQIGARILADVKQLEDVVPGVLHHHERYDGRGYPAGLSGKDVPLVGRIICLADCFDAMTSNRTYRKALPLEVALNEIRRCSGTQFDPALAEVFLTITPDQFRMLLRDHQLQAKRLLELQETLRAA